MSPNSKQMYPRLHAVPDDSEHTPVFHLLRVAPEGEATIKLPALEYEAWVQSEVLMRDEPDLDDTIATEVIPRKALVPAPVAEREVKLFRQEDSADDAVDVMINALFSATVTVEVTNPVIRTLRLVKPGPVPSPSRAVPAPTVRRAPVQLALDPLDGVIPPPLPANHGMTPEGRPLQNVGNPWQVYSEPPPQVLFAPTVQRPTLEPPPASGSMATKLPLPVNRSRAWWPPSATQAALVAMGLLILMTLLIWWG